jgi:hypothetical protein
VYRANLPRTFVLVAALFSMAATTGVFAREFRAADPYLSNLAPIGTFIPSMDALVGDEILNGFEPHQFVGLAFHDSGTRLIYDGRPEKFDRKPFAEATAAIYQKTRCNPAAAELIDLIGQVE